MNGGEGMMDEQQLFGEWRTRSPDSDQEYFIDKMRMLKLKLRKCEEENRVLYRCLAEQKNDARDAQRDKSFVINSFQFELSELRKHILCLLGVLANEGEGEQINGQPLKSNPSNLSATTTNEYQSSTPSPLLINTDHMLVPSEYEKSVWLQRNRTLEENFKKELKKVKELEHQVGDLSETLQQVGRDREDLVEKNAFLEEENNIQREQIVLLEETVRDLEEVATIATRDAEVQTDVSGQQLLAIVSENMEEIMCLVKKLRELQARNDDLECKYSDTREELLLLRYDYHARGQLMNDLENQLNAMKLLDRSHAIVPTERRDNNYCIARNNLVMIKGSPTGSSGSSRSSRSSADFDDEENSIALNDSLELRKTEVRKFIRNLKNRRQTLYDAHRN